MDTSAEPSRSSRVTPAQVIALGLVAASIGWGAWVLRDRPASEEVELLPGTVLPSSELAIVEAAFDRAQLSGHRTEDGRVWVSRPRQSAYMRALVDAEALPREFGSSLRRALESNSPWQSRAAQEELLRVAVQEELAHVICSMPGIERAAVLYDVNDRAAFDGTLGGGPTQTASVNVRTQPDVELEPSRVQAIRVLVAASIAGLDPERVAVTDLRSGHVHAGPLSPVDAAEPPPVADPALARQIAHEHHLVSKVRQGLAFVKGAVVDVTVTFADDTAPAPPVEPNLPPRQQRVADANAPAEVEVTEAAAVAPVPSPSREGHIDSIVVSVAVPETWFDAVVRAARQRDTQMAVAEVDRREEERLRGHILELLPPISRADGRRVVITRFPVVSSRPEPPPRPGAAGSVSSSAPPAATGNQTATATPAAAPSTIGDYIDVTIQAVSEGRFGDVPREVWMVFTAKCSAILAYILFHSGARSADGRSSRRRAADAGQRSPRSRIDWTTVDDAPDADTTAAVPPRRMAA
jgi:type III secretory pathway lipoprotein EscJ